MAGPVDAQEIVDALPDGVVVADSRGRVELISAPAVRMLGVEGNPVGQPLEFVLALTDHDGNGWVGAQPALRGAGHADRGPRADLAAAQRHRGAGRREAAPGLRWSSPVEQVAVTLRSGRGRARLDRERSDLVATVAHELRSPLTGVKGFVARAAEPLGPAQRRPEEADARDRRGRRRPAEPADRRAARRGAHRHRPAPAAPAALRRGRADDPDRRVRGGGHGATGQPARRGRPARGAGRPGQVHPGRS